MPTVQESLSVWEIAHRWAGYDPDSYRLRHPLLVKDNFKLLMEAILDGHLYCETLTLAKRPHDSKADARYYIRTHLDDVHQCIWGFRYSKKLLKWAVVPRSDFQEWCERLSIPLPDFWFPAGWKLNFEMPEFGTRAFWAHHVEPDEVGGFAQRFSVPKIEPDEDTQSKGLTDDNQSVRVNQKVKISVQQVASQLWKEFPKRTIAEMSRDPVIQEYAGASHYTDSAVRKWLSAVAPVNIKGKRGRPRNKPDKEGD